MPLSYIEYTTGLGARTYNVPINYISINDISAIGYDGNTYDDLPISSRSAANKQITLTAAPSSSYERIRIFRSTTQAQLVDFQSGSRLSESDLDTAYQQALFVAQEIAEDANTSQFQGLLNAGLMGGTSLANFASEDLSSQVNGTLTTFNISNFEVLTTAQEAYRVTIDGIMQSPTDAYAMLANPARITFTSAPPSGSKVIIVTAASAASSSTVDNDTIGLKVVNGQSKLFIKDKGVDSLQIETDAINKEKIKDKAVQKEHLETELQTALDKVINADTFPTENSYDLVKSHGVYKAIQELNTTNLEVSNFKPSDVVADNESWTAKLMEDTDSFATNGAIEERIRSFTFPKTFTRKQTSEYDIHSDVNQKETSMGTGGSVGNLSWFTNLSGSTGGVTDSFTNSRKKLTVSAVKGTIFSYRISFRV